MKPYAMRIDVGGIKIAAGVLDRDINILSRCMTKEHAGQLPAERERHRRCGYGL